MFRFKYIAFMNHDDKEEWNLLHWPTKDPEPLKYTAISAVIDDERVTIDLNTGTISIYDIGNPKCLEVDGKGNVLKLINLAHKR